MAKQVSERTIELPTDLSERLKSLISYVADRLSSGAAEVPTGEVADDIKSFLEGRALTLSRQLAMFEDAIGLGMFSGRVLLYHREMRNKRPTWRLGSPEFAAPVAMSDRPDHLRQLMAQVHRKAEAKVSIALWVHATQTPRGFVPSAVLRHSSGLEQLYLLRGHSWVLVPVAGDELSSVISSMLTPSRGDLSFWRQALDSLVRAVLEIDDESKESVRAALAVDELTPSMLNAFVKAALINEGVFDVLREIARAVCAEPLQEAQALLMISEEIAGSAVEKLKEAETRATQERSKLEKRMTARADRLEQHNKALGTQIQRLQAELGAAKTSLSAARAVALPVQNANARQYPAAGLRDYFEQHLL